MELGIKTQKREFRFSSDLSITEELSIAQTWVEDVIGGIEKDELLVFPADKKADLQSRQADGSILFNVGATEPVSIREWLCVGCQKLRWGNLDEFSDREDCGAFYKSNAPEVLWPVSGIDEPVGPVAFSAEIALNPGLTNWVSSGFEAKFKFVVAHELVHVFDYMRLIVPAFRDWASFWEVVLLEGTLCDWVVETLHDTSRFVDSYGEENELAMVQDYWPSQADGWFKAMRS